MSYSPEKTAKNFDDPVSRTSEKKNLTAEDAANTDNLRISANEEARLETFVGPPGVWYECSEFQLRFLRDYFGLQQNHCVLDMGCGVLRGGIRLIDYLDEERYYGIDIRPEVIEEAKVLLEKLDLTHKKSTLLCTDDFGKGIPTKFDYIWAFQVFYHLTDDLLDLALKTIKTKLQPDGLCFANINTIFGNNTNQWQGFPFTKKERQFFIDMAERNGLEAEFIGQLKDFAYTDKVNGQYNEMLKIVHPAK